MSTYAQARDAFRRKELRQALYDEGDVVMSDVLVNLHGADHRARRRLENRLFRKDTHRRYEREFFPPVVAATLAPHVASGRAELVTLSHEMMMNLAAFTAGVDRPQGTREETLHLYSYLMLFIQGATLAHYTGDREAKRAEVAAGLAVVRRGVPAAVDRPASGVARRGRGRHARRGRPAPRRADHVDAPRGRAPARARRGAARDLLLPARGCAHQRHRVRSHAPPRVRDGARTVPRTSSWHGTDLSFLQRCVHETVRLQPSSPIAMRWALADVDLPGGVHVPTGARLTIDLMAVNRDPEVFGDDADAFDPHRVLGPGVAPWGLSFGLGMHACIGQDLAAGLDPVGAARSTTTTCTGWCRSPSGRCSTPAADRTRRTRRRWTPTAAAATGAAIPSCSPVAVFPT